MFSSGIYRVVSFGAGGGFIAEYHGLDRIIRKKQSFKRVFDC
jgi:hypothetical protein